MNCAQHLFNPEWILVGIMGLLGIMALIALVGLVRAMIKM